MKKWLNLSAVFAVNSFLGWNNFYNCDQTFLAFKTLLQQNSSDTLQDFYDCNFSSKLIHQSFNIKPDSYVVSFETVKVLCTTARIVSPIRLKDHT